MDLESSSESQHLFASINGSGVRRKSENEFVSVDIQSLDPISQAKKECDRWVLRWYRLLLKMLGWMPFTCAPERVQTCLHMPLIAFWVIMILGAFVAQILSCFRRDTIVQSHYPSNSSHVHGKKLEIECQEHVGSSFIITDIPILLAYGLGVYLFSKEFRETEYLSNLAEKVFIQTCTVSRPRDNKSLVKKLSCFLISGGVWIVLSTVVRIMTIISLSLFSDDVVIRWGSTELSGAAKVLCTLVALFGFVFFDVVYIVAVMNYAAQSEMNIHLLRATHVRVQQRIEYPDINAAIKDIEECHDYVKVLNGKTALITALILFNLGSLGLLALISVDQIWDDPDLLHPEYDKQEPFLKPLATVVAVFNTILWLGLFSFPVVQAARVTYAGSRLKAMGTYVRSRPFNYSTISQLDKDSLLQFTQAIELTATMFGIPVYPWTVYAGFVGFTFTMLILLQTRVYSIYTYI